jgi:hypothetical protein
MDQLTKFLVRELVDGKSVTAIYGGGFKPPTKGHFDLVKTALKDFKDIDKFLIYVGGGIRDGIEQEQSLQVWDIYKELLPSKVQIEPSASPIGDILRYAKNHPDEKVYFVLGYREGREDDLQDVKNRTKGVEEKYPNLEVRVIKTPAGDMSGTNARKALQKGDKEKFFTFLPTEIPANEKEDIYNILEPNIFKENVAPNHKGKSAPFGSGYKPLKENTIPSIDILEKIAELTNYMREKGYNIDPVPSISIVDDDTENAGKFLGKTAYYDPINKSITLYTYGRHPKDIVRSFSHEMIHHIQNLEGRLGDVSTTNTLEDDHINDLEKEANLKGTMTFRNWTDGLQENLTKEDQVNQLERLLNRWSAYSGQYDLLPQIAKLAKGLRVNNGPSIVYRAVPGLDEYPYTKQEIIDFDKEQEIVSTTSTKEQAEYFINNADWAYILEYKPHIIINFDEFEKKYGWTGNWGEGELLIDVPKSKLLKITKVDIIKEKKNKDPFGLNQYARELAKGLEEEQVNENALADIIAKLAAPLINLVINRAIDGLFGYIDDIKNIVAPEPYIKFLKGLEKNDEFNKQFIELVIQRDKEKNPPLGNEWRELTTNLPAFKEAFDKFAEEQGIEGSNKSYLLSKISITMWDTYLKTWKKIHQILKKKYPDLTQDLKETQLTEGRYDKLTNELSSFAFELMKDGYDVGKKVVDELFVVGPADEDSDIISNDFEFDFVIQAVYTDDTYKVDGGANAGFDDEKEEIQPLLTVRFEIPKDIDWQTVSFDLKDVIRHELEHLTQDGANVRPGKKIEDDKFIRNMINADLLPKADYFRLEKEIDAMLQGLYLKAKKSRKPYLEVIDDYLDTQPINQEERKEILDLWAKRAKALSLPPISSAPVKKTSYLHDTGVEKKDEEMREKKYVIFCDMDGVLVDFDEGYKQLTGVTTQHADSQGKDEFWKLYRDSLKNKDISERSYWANLDWMPDGKQLWDYIKEYNPYVLTAPSVNFDIPFEERYKLENNESMQGKTEWVQRLPNMRKIYFRSAQRKADFAGPNKILIDDRKDTIDSWNANGGIGILHTSTANTIKQLQELGL